MVGWSSIACEDEEIVVPPPRAPTQRPVAETPDRLPPGKIMEGPEVVHGFAIPKGMEVTRPTRDMVRATGYVDFDDLTDYVKERIAVRYAEMLDGKLVFANAAIRGTPGRVFEVTLRTQQNKTILEIDDQTKGPPVEGLTQKERWERTGMTPEGKLIDPSSME